MLSAHPEAFPPRAFLINEETQPAYVFNIVAGTVTMSILLPDGRRRVLGFAVPGDLIGVSAPDGFAYSALAAGVVSAWRIRRSQLIEVCRTSSDLLQALHEQTLRELSRAFRHVILLEGRSASEKVAEFILDHEARWQAAGSVSNALPLPMSRQDIAGYLGLAHETVSRTLANLERLGLIALSPHALTIVNRGSLVELAKGDEQAPSPRRRSQARNSARADERPSPAVWRRP